MKSLLKKIRMLLIRFKYRRFLSAGKNFTCGRGTIFFAQNKIDIGDNVYFGRYCNIECDSIIGSDVLIANNVGFVGRLDHDYTRVGVPVRFAPSVRDPEYSVPSDKSTITIGDDVWIGYGATILSGVKVNNGAVVAAGSLVTKEVDAFTIVGGVPARHLSKRFEPDEILRHINICRQQYASYK